VATTGGRSAGRVGRRPVAGPVNARGERTLYRREGDTASAGPHLRSASRRRPI